MEQQFSSKATTADITMSNDTSKGQFLTSIPFLKGLGSQRKITQSTGQPPKKRGPKPDTKPAQTRRQELNRQAQRTHRERKEQYVRALESEISRLREGYSELTKTSHTTNEQLKQALQAVIEENKVLQQILRSHGIAFEHEIPTVKNLFGGGKGGGGGNSSSSSRGVPGAPSSDGGNTHRGTTGTSSPHETQYSGQGSMYGNSVTQRGMMKISPTPSLRASSMTADTSVSPSSAAGGNPAEQHMAKGNSGEEQFLRPEASMRNMSDQASGVAISVSGPDTSVASADHNQSLSFETSTASTSILQPPPPPPPPPAPAAAAAAAEDASMTSFPSTLPLPPLSPQRTFASVNSGASSEMNQVAWTGHGSQRNLIDKGEAMGAVPGAFEKDPQLEMDFILTLESPCRDHMEFLNRRATNDPDQELYCGHALMATCPPPSQVLSTPPGQLYPLETYDLPPANLTKLLNLSRQLVSEGQITPIMAVQNLKCHDAYNELTTQDIRQIINELSNKIRCYGFGAVMEDFEFMDSLSAILSSKAASASGEGVGLAGRAADRYKQMFGHKLAAMNAQKTPEGRYIGGGGVAGPGMPQVDEFLFA